MMRQLTHVISVVIKRDWMDVDLSVHAELLSQICALGEQNQSMVIPYTFQCYIWNAHIIVYTRTAESGMRSIHVITCK